MSSLSLSLSLSLIVFIFVFLIYTHEFILSSFFCLLIFWLFNYIRIFIFCIALTHLKQKQKKKNTWRKIRQQLESNLESNWIFFLNFGFNYVYIYIYMNFPIIILLHTWQFNMSNTSDTIISQQNLCDKLLVVRR